MAQFVHIICSLILQWNSADTIIDGSITMDYILFFYSLGFVMLAAVSLTLRQSYGVKVPWTWLALFGLTHAVNEWLSLLVRDPESSISFAAARTGLMIFSFLCVFLFCRAGLIGVMSKAAAVSEKRYHTLVEASPNCIILLDRDGKCVTVNRAGLAAMELAAEEIVGRKFSSIWPEDARSTVESSIDQVIRGSQTSFEAEYHRRSSGPAIWQVMLNPIKDEDGEIRYFVAIATDITDKKNYEEQLDRLAHQDPLTGLPNRLLFNARLTQEISRAHRNEQTLAVMFLDLDRFKITNDTLGHNVGDLLLKAVAERLQDALRESDTIARMGGDEFTIILPEIHSAKDAAKVAQRLLNSVSDPFIIDDEELYITASIGISLYPSDGEDVETLVRNADTAMYRAKELGRNNYHLYTEALNAAILERLNLENNLRKAVERQEFVLHYQPRVNIQTGRVVGVEALLRWQHSELGLMSPAQFISLAEETGLIVPISEWVIQSACAQNRYWQEQGLPPVPVAVNISARQFQHGELLDIVKRALDKNFLDPHYLEIEITESALMQNPDVAVVMLRVFKSMGIRISIDDFGTGYSSLACLKRLPIDSLKIDRSFVRDITMNPDDAAIAGAVVALAHTLNLTVTAEGVETAEQLEFLKSIGCEEMQGYLISKPLPADEIVEFLANQSSSPDDKMQAA